jgi:Mrp family chromosome partitioning ATPase
MPLREARVTPMAVSLLEGGAGMSKNFELMQEELRELDRQTAATADPAAIPFSRVDLDEKISDRSSEFDRAAQEECLKLVQRIFLAQPAGLHRMVVFSGVDRGNGCTRICLETARILAANAPGSVCLVEANFRAPSLGRLCGFHSHRGFTESLAEGGGIRTFARRMESPNLWLLPAGSVGSNSPSLLNSDSMKERLQELRKEFEYVLVDAPALNVCADALALGRGADGMVVVLQADATRRESAVKALEGVREARIEILGAVLNRRTFPIPEFVYRRL